MEAVAPQWQVFGVAEFLPGQAFQCSPQLFPIAAFDVGMGNMAFLPFLDRSGVGGEIPFPLDDLPHPLVLFPGCEPPPCPIAHGYLLLCKEIVAERVGRNRPIPFDRIDPEEKSANKKSIGK